jgi:transposase
MKYQLQSSEGIENKLQLLCVNEKGTLRVAFDMEKEGAMVVASWQEGAPIVLGKDTRERLHGALGRLRETGIEIITVQEACGMGYGFHRALEAAGIRSMVVAPETLNGKRKTDRLDALKLCTKLLDFDVRGDKKQFKVVRVPTVEQERRRALWRQRSQVLKTRNMLTGQGRCLMMENGVTIVPERWWGPRIWPRLSKKLDPWLISMLDPHRRIILEMTARMQELEDLGIPGEREPDGCRPVGLGEGTRQRLKAEVLDWGRFKNRGEVGSFIGCAPSEYSSGATRRLGSIDRQGNGRMRSMLVEAVWRLRMWNSSWRGLQKFRHVLGRGTKAGPAAKKKAVVACARLLAIDIWRIETGRIKPEDVGLKAV